MPAIGCLAACIVLTVSQASTAMAAKPRTLLDSLVPAPRTFSIVFDNPKDAGGIDPATGQPYPAVGQYADTATNTVHTTRGYAPRLIAQDVGQLVGFNVLSPGDQHYFSRLLGSDPAHWSGTQGAQPGERSGAEDFANYFAVAATGGMKPGESLAWGDTPIDASVLRKYTAALGRLGRRNHLQPLNLTKALTAAK